MDIFNLIKTQDFDKLKNILLENKNIDIEIKDENNNYLLHYIVNFNKIDILKILLDRNIRIDILDFDGRTILYIPIKYILLQNGNLGTKHTETIRATYNESVFG
jgi:ankyrin repeat protein